MKQVFSVVFGTLLMASVAQAKVETFKMYDEPNQVPSEFCDRYTELKLEATKDGLVAKLRNRVSGSCDMHVPPNVRSYTMTELKPSCGSKIFVAADEYDDAKLIDHRTRLCENIVPAALIFKESNGSDVTRTLYSSDK